MTDTPASPNRQWIRQLVDFGALLAFAGSFAVLRLRGVESSEAIIGATWVLVGASAFALVVGYLVERRFAPLPLITGGFALIFGVMTIVFHDPSLVKIKLSVQNGLLAIILLGSIPLKKYPFKYLLGESIRVTDAAWRVLTLRYGLYFLTIAVVNEFVWRTQPDGVWVQFRVGLFVLAIVFGLLQIPYILKHMLKDGDETTDEAGPGPTTPDTGL